MSGAEIRGCDFPLRLFRYRCPSVPRYSHRVLQAGISPAPPSPVLFEYSHSPLTVFSRFLKLMHEPLQGDSARTSVRLRPATTLAARRPK